jgi:hypothetical protein
MLCSEIRHHVHWYPQAIPEQANPQMEAANSSEMLVVTMQPTHHHTPEGILLRFLSNYPVFLTAFAVFRKPNTIPLCFSIDLVLNLLVASLQLGASPGGG